MYVFRGLLIVSALFVSIGFALYVYLVWGSLVRTKVSRRGGPSRLGRGPVPTWVPTAASVGVWSVLGPIVLTLKDLAVWVTLSAGYLLVKVSVKVGVGQWEKSRTDKVFRKR